MTMSISLLSATLKTEIEARPAIGANAEGADALEALCDALATAVVTRLLADAELVHALQADAVEVTGTVTLT